MYCEHFNVRFFFCKRFHCITEFDVGVPSHEGTIDLFKSSSCEFKISQQRGNSRICKTNLPEIPYGELPETAIAQDDDDLIQLARDITTKKNSKNYLEMQKFCYIQMCP